MSYLLNKRSDSNHNLGTKNKSSKQYSAAYASNFKPGKPIQLPPDTGSWTLEGPISNVPLGTLSHAKGAQMGTWLTNPLDKALMGERLGFRLGSVTVLTLTVTDWITERVSRARTWPVAQAFCYSPGWWFQQPQAEVNIKPKSSISRESSLTIGCFIRDGCHRPN